MAYCTTAQVKTFLRISSSSDDALIGTLVTQSQAEIDQITRRTFEASSDTMRRHSAVRDVQGARLWLRGELAALTSVTNGDDAALVSFVTTFPRNTAEGPSVALDLMASSAKAWKPESDGDEWSIQVTGRWAYSTSAPDAIVLAHILLTAYHYRLPSAHDGSAELGELNPYALKRRAEAILAPYVLRPRVGFA